MPSYRLVAKVDREQAPEPCFVVRAPAVGVVDAVPQTGVYLNPSEVFASLTILNRRYLVQLPRDVQGMVSEQMVVETYAPVGYGQALLRLSEASAMVDRLRGAGGGKGLGAGETSADAELIAVTAPSDGVFYLRPSPESPPYVREGAPVSSGTVLGLVEVMKSFNQIAYGGPGLPERGTVARVLVGDAVEVAFGQTLFLVRPA